MAAIRVAGTDVVLAGREGETLTQTLFRAGFALRIGCQRGGCGICLVHRDAGRVRYEKEPCEQALPAADRARGLELACRAMPEGDVTISVPPEGRLRCIAPMLAELAAQPPQPPPPANHHRRDKTNPASSTPSEKGIQLIT